MKNITNSNFFDTLSRKMTSSFLTKGTFAAVGNSQSINGSASQPVDHYFKKVGILLLFIFAGLTTAVAQTDPTLACTSGCTAKDIKIESAYLSYADGTPLPDTFICSGGTAKVYLTLVLETKSPRIGTSIYGVIKNYDPVTQTTYGEGIPLSECFGGETLNTTTKVTFSDFFIWDCSQTIALTDVYIAWGTGNTDFCAGTEGNFKCGATPSKCNRQPGNIIIGVPNPGEASDSTCSLVDFPDYSAYFNLTSYETAIANGGNVTISWYSDAALTKPIEDVDESTVDLDFHATAASTDVYAKVCPVGGTSCVTRTVPLTVKPKPAPPTICIVQPSASLCDNTTTAGSITVTAPVDGGGIDYQYSLDGGAWVEDPVFSGLPANSVTSGVRVRTITNSVGGCPSDAASCGDDSCASRTAAKTTNTVSNKVAAITPIATQTEKAGFDAYPVPFKDQLSIKYNFDYESDVKIEVFNAQGIRVFSKTDTNGYLNKETALDLKMNKGKEQMYVVKITTNRGSTTKKVMSSK